MATYPGAAIYLPDDRSLASLAHAVQACRGCDLYEKATQAVLGEGAAEAEMMFVGEQPGDREDIEGRPFVGPAGRILDKAFEDLHIARNYIYLTNAVKHFRWEPRGKRRIHQTPRASEMRACLPWLEAEIDAVKPRLIVRMGATAVGAILGNTAKVTTHRGSVMESPYGPCLVTTHPSSIIRVEDTDEREAAYALFLADLRGGLRFLDAAA
jgi:DNA polymerase